MSKIEEMLKQLCPEGVERVQVGSLCMSVTNVQWRDDKRSYRYIDLSSVDRETHLIGATIEIAAEDAPSRAQQIVRTGDVLFATTRPTQMRLCFVPNAYDGQICSTGYVVLRPNVDILNPRWIYYQLCGNAFCRYCERNQIQGGAYPSITNGSVKAFEIPFPPRPVQDEIVKALDAMDAVVKSLEEERAARQEQFEAVMEDVFEKLLSQGVKQEPFSIHSEYIRGITYSKNDETENEKDSFVVLRANNISLECSDIKLEDVKRVASTVRIKREQFLKLGDVLICAGSGSKAHIGKVAYIDKNYEFAFGGFMAVIRSDAMLNNKFTFYVLRSNGFKSFLKRRLSGGAAINNLDASIMNEFSVPVPPRPVQDEIVKVLDAMDAVVKALDEEIAARREQFAGWLEKLMKFDTKEVA